MKIVFLGLSITSSWGNGHATTYRGLLRELARRGHELLFLERDTPWYAEHRDLPHPPYCRTALYQDEYDLLSYAPEIADADAVIVGSYVPDGAAVAEWVLQNKRGITAFYDIDTPVTLANLARGEHNYLSPDLIPRFDLYLSFTGGPTLEVLERKYGAQKACAFYCSVDPTQYFPDSNIKPSLDLGYLGTYSVDRHPGVNALLLEPARKLPARNFSVAGSLYPGDLVWPSNVEHTEHLDPSRHCGYYNSQRFTLNITRSDMVRAGWSPSVRLFEAAACGVPIITDSWEGLDHFFKPGSEILTANSSEQVREILCHLPETERLRMGQRARQRLLSAHTAAHRALELEHLLEGQFAQHSASCTPADLQTTVL